MSQSGITKVSSSGIPGDVATSYVCDIGVAVPSSHILDVNGGTNVQTIGSGNQILINITASSSFTWNIVTSANNPVQIVKNNGYICQGSSQIIFILPLSGSLGDPFSIFSQSARFQIQQNGGQQFQIGSQVTTAGAGTVASNTTGDFVSAILINNTFFLCMAPQGTLSIS